MQGAVSCGSRRVFLEGFSEHLDEPSGWWWIGEDGGGILRPMKRPDQLIQRSFSMILASYYLARCGEAVSGGPSNPPMALGVQTWREAYNLFYESMGDGRTRSQFRNSMKAVRDTFDILFDNGRVGWKDAEGRQPGVGPSYLPVHEEWKDRTDGELAAVIVSLISGAGFTPENENSMPIARTEGGLKVYLSVRRERDPRLREDALAIHGVECMACGFNFQKTYGDLGRGFIEVHHVVPLSELERTETDPATDLIVLCSNCHRMVHRRKGVCVSLEELRKHLQR